MSILPITYPTERWKALAEDARHLRNELIRLTEKRVIWTAHNQSLESISIKDSTSIVHHWLRSNYTESMIVGFRRILDRTKGTRSLIKLLDRISQDCQEFTFARYLSLYSITAEEHHVELAAADFSLFSGDGKTIDRSLVEADINRLRSDSKELIEYANSRITHWRPDQPQQAVLKLTYDQLHKAFDDVGAVLNKYHLLLTASQGTYEPAMPFGYEKAFARMVKGSGKKLESRIVLRDESSAPQSPDPNAAE